MLDLVWLAIHVIISWVEVSAGKEVDLKYSDCPVLNVYLNSHYDQVYVNLNVI